MSEKPNDDNGNNNNPRKRILDWEGRDKDILNNCLTILSDLLEDTEKSSGESSKKQKMDKNDGNGGEKKKAKPSEPGKAGEAQEANANSSSARTSGATTAGDDPAARMKPAVLRLRDLYKQLFNIDIVVDETGDPPQFPFYRTQYFVTDLNGRLISSSQEITQAGRPVKCYGRFGRCLSKPGRGPAMPNPVNIRIPEQQAQQAGTGQEMPGNGQGTPEGVPTAANNGQGTSAQDHGSTNPEQGAAGNGENGNATVDNYMRAEHELKMQQMAEAHEWARKEHLLKIQEQELKIEYVKLQKQLLQKQLQE